MAKKTDFEDRLIELLEKERNKKSKSIIGNYNKDIKEKPTKNMKLIEDKNFSKTKPKIKKIPKAKVLSDKSKIEILNKNEISNLSDGKALSKNSKIKIIDDEKPKRPVKTKRISGKKLSEKPKIKLLKKEVQPKKSEVKTLLKNSNVKVVKRIKIPKIDAKVKKLSSKDFPTLNLKSDREIAMDFAIKTYKVFDKLIKSIVLFGSSVKKKAVPESDIDIIIILDDSTIIWDEKMIAWYRSELKKIIESNPYKKNLHLNTIRLTIWWEDLMRGDPVVLNILRYSDPLLDLAGFFEPLKFLLATGRIRPSPEAIYNCLQKAPLHIQRSKNAELNSIEGLYWSMVESAHAALIAAGKTPPSPEHISLELMETFVKKNKLNKKYIKWYNDLLALHKGISHGKIHDLRGVEIDMWQERSEIFLETMARIVRDYID